MLISVVILNYNGKEYLGRVVESAIALAWSDLEIIIVDNASTDGSPDNIERRFGDRVRVVRRTVNSATAGRNQGFREANGEIIFSIDNDIVLPDHDIVAKAVALFQHFPDVGVLACKIGSEDHPHEPLRQHWWFPVPIEQGKGRYFYSDYVCEGAAFLRRNAFLASGGYDEDFLWGFEAVDFALGMLRSGFQIVFSPDLIAAELRVRRAPHQQRNINNYYSLRNRLWTAWKHYSIPKAIGFGASRLLVGLFRASRGGWIDYFVRGALDGIFAPATIRSKRHPLSKATRLQIKKIHEGVFLYPSEMFLSNRLDVPAAKHKQ